MHAINMDVIYKDTRQDKNSQNLETIYDDVIDKYLIRMLLIERIYKSV